MKKKMRQKKNHGRLGNGGGMESSPVKQVLNNIHEKNVLNRFPSTEMAPWLVFFSHGKGGKTHTICSIGDRKTFVVNRIPQIARKKCGVCLLGWILTEDRDTKDVTLLDPVSMESIELPPIPRLPPLYRVQECFRGDWSFQMTAPPTNKSSIIILSYCLIPYVIFCYPHEKKWFVRKCKIEKDDDCFLSIAVVNGNIYGYTFSGKLVQLIFNHCNFTTKCPQQQMLQKELYFGHGDAFYLVQSCGNLYMVQINRFPDTRAVKGFIVSKMNFIEMRWEEAKDIGENRAFLVDLVSEGISCCATEAGLQKNCIYYVNGDNYLYQYNLEDNSITMLSYFPRLRLPEHTFPRWLLPQSKDLTNIDECKETSKICENTQGCHIGPEINSEEEYKIGNIENRITTSSKPPYQKIRKSAVSVSCCTSERGDIWSNLLGDLVLDIMHHLSYLDSRCALLAIPEWMSAVCTIAKPIGTWYLDSPCLLTFSNECKTCTLMDPIRNVRHLIQNPADLSSKLRIVSAKHGWLLLRGPTRDIVFFYNPLSKAIIKLPQPPKIFPPSLRFSFSHPPTAPNCVVVADYLHPNSKRILICCKGDNLWTELLVEYGQEDEMFMVGATTAVFAKDKFHWLSLNGMLGVVDLTTRSWAIFHTHKFEKLPISDRYYLVESEDEIFRVWVGKTGDSIRVYMVDYSTFTWNEVKSLGGRCFFLLQNASLSVSAAMLGNKENKIYFPMLQNEQMVHYSYDAHQMLPSETFYGAKEFLLNSCWIQPFWVQPTSEELQWF